MQCTTDRATAASEQDEHSDFPKRCKTRRPEYLSRVAAFLQVADDLHRNEEKQTTIKSYN